MSSEDEQCSTVGLAAELDGDFYTMEIYTMGLEDHVENLEIVNLKMNLEMKKRSLGIYRRT